MSLLPASIVAAFASIAVIVPAFYQSTHCNRRVVMPVFVARRRCTSASTIRIFRTWTTLQRASAGALRDVLPIDQPLQPVPAADASASHPHSRRCLFAWLLSTSVRPALDPRPEGPARPKCVLSGAFEDVARAESATRVEMSKMRKAQTCLYVSEQCLSTVSHRSWACSYFGCHLESLHKPAKAASLPTMNSSAALCFLCDHLAPIASRTLRAVIAWCTCAPACPHSLTHLKPGHNLRRRAPGGRPSSACLWRPVRAPGPSVVRSSGGRRGSSDSAWRRARTRRQPPQAQNSFSTTISKRLQLLTATDCLKNGSWEAPGASAL